MAESRINNIRGKKNIPRSLQIQILRRKYRQIHNLIFLFSILVIIIIVVNTLPYIIPFDINFIFIGILFFVVSILSIIIIILAYSYKKEKKTLPIIYYRFLPKKVLKIEFFPIPVGMVNGIFVFLLVIFILQKSITYSLIIFFIIIGYSIFSLKKKSFSYIIKYIGGGLSYLVILSIATFFFLPPHFLPF